MNITVEIVEGTVPVTVVRTEGDLDGKTFQSLIDKALELCDAGSRHLLLDLSGTEYISSAGLVALQSIAQLMRGEDLLDTDAGWAAMHAVTDDDSAEHRPYFKLLNLQPQVDKALDTVGFKAYFDIFTDRDEAMAAFTG
jgi:anti-anti-sigma factor